MAEEGFLDFNKDGGILEMIGAEHSPGMEVMTGSLGQGISQAAGIALARKLKGEPGKVWVFMSRWGASARPGLGSHTVHGFYRLENLWDLRGH